MIGLKELCNGEIFLGPVLHEETTHQHRTIVVPSTLTPTTEEEKQQSTIALQETSKAVGFQCNSIILNSWNAELKQCVEVGDVNVHGEVGVNLFLNFLTLTNCLHILPLPCQYSLFYGSSSVPKVISKARIRHPQPSDERGALG